MLHEVHVPQHVTSERDRPPVVPEEAPDFVKRWKKSFWMLGGGHDYAGALAGLIKKAVTDGTLNNKVAMVSVADGFGIDLVNAARPAFAEAGIELVYDKTYPVGTSDFSPMINEAKASGAEAKEVAMVADEDAVVSGMAVVEAEASWTAGSSMRRRSGRSPLT